LKYVLSSGKPKICLDTFGLSEEVTLGSLCLLTAQNSWFGVHSFLSGIYIYINSITESKLIGSLEFLT